MEFKDFVDKNNIYVFCDMDGVLTDFLPHFEEYDGRNLMDISKSESYAATRVLPIEFWSNMPWMMDGKTLWKFLTNHFVNLHILSAPTRDKEHKSEIGKMEWLTKHGIVDQLGEKNIILDEQKHKHIKSKGTSILIDDRDVKINKWEDHGGVGILHTSAEDTIEQLQPYV